MVSSRPLPGRRGSGNSNGVPVSLHDCHGKANQQWSTTSSGASGLRRPVPRHITGRPSTTGRAAPVGLRRLAEPALVDRGRAKNDAFGDCLTGTNTTDSILFTDPARPGRSSLGVRAGMLRVEPGRTCLDDSDPQQVLTQPAAAVPARPSAWSAARSEAPGRCLTASQFNDVDLKPCTSVPRSRLELRRAWQVDRVLSATRVGWITAWVSRRPHRTGRPPCLADAAAVTR